MVSEIFLKIYGQVHGVGFRYHAEKTARSLKLAGYVRNANGGTIEILAQGKKENLEKLITWAGSGPDSASVEKIETEWREPSEIFSDFTITD